MPSIFSEFPTKYIKVADLGGQDATFIIESLIMEQVEDGKPDTKPVVKFAGQKQGLVLNKTNATTIAGMYGEDYSQWAGKPVTLFPTTCEMAGETKSCIRIRPVASQTQVQPQQIYQQPQGYVPPTQPQQWPQQPTQQPYMQPGQQPPLGGLPQIQYGQQ